MKVFIIIAMALGGSFFYGNGQNKKVVDSLNALLEKTARDTNRVKLYLRISDQYFFTRPDSARLVAEKALALSRELYYVEGEVKSLYNAGEMYRYLGDYPRALKLHFDALKLYRQMNDKNGEAIILGFIGFDYVEFREYKQGIEYLITSSKLKREVHNQLGEAFDLSNIANAYNLLGMPDSGLYYSKLAYNTYTGLTHGPLKSLILARMGNAYLGLGRRDSALTYYETALAISIKVSEKVGISNIMQKIAEAYKLEQEHDSSFYYARQAFTYAQQSAQKLELLETSELLSNLFRIEKNIDSAFYYEDIAKAMTDSLYGPQKFKELQLLILQEQQQQQEIQQSQEKYKNKTRMIALWSVVGILIIIAIIFYRNNRQKQKANKILENTLTYLKATQSQLIQSEKMASLGELTAGIAHEIQNPLNFVNNFSDVNKELVDELQQELKAGKVDDAIAISNDIKENEEKINHHGKRADAIVKGMLQHSRTSSGQKEPTDINALADEYLRLSYHGLRAKDKSFNADFKTDFDDSIGKINIIPQDIGRVILNLINNAFYTVDEKKKLNSNGYEPTVLVSTKKNNGKVEIKVSDNGNGIPQKVLDKIFQPFFTTKPTGQGTGLGLSLSYDIVKAHGGELKVETHESKGTTFMIVLPST